MYIGGGGSIGAPSGTNIYNASDERLKQDITDASSAWNDIKAVRIRKYRLKQDIELHKSNPNLGEAPYLLGVVAQELEQTSPKLIKQAKLEDGSPDESTMKEVKTSILSCFKIF